MSELWNHTGRPAASGIDHGLTGQNGMPLHHPTIEHGSSIAR